MNGLDTRRYEMLVCEALREHLEAITRTARAMALDMPGVDDKFRPPRGSGDQRLIETARQFAHDAAPLANEFVKHAIPANFLDDLDSDIKALEEAIKVRESGQGTHVAARASINAAMEAALAAVRRLDAIVPNTVGNECGNACPVGACAARGLPVVAPEGRRTGGGTRGADSIDNARRGTGRLANDGDRTKRRHSGCVGGRHEQAP
jgi:hypothetical protein